LSAPASICLKEANDVFIPGLILGRSPRFGLPDCALGEPIAASCVAPMVTAPIAAFLIKARRVAEYDGLDIMLLPGRVFVPQFTMLS
jgi:hypothetical protein